MSFATTSSGERVSAAVVAGAVANDAAAGAAPGLVTWAITARVSTSPGQSLDRPAVPEAPPQRREYADLEADRDAVDRGWVPAFPSAELVKSAASLWQPVPWDGGEGPRPALIVGPGVISLRRTDLAKRERRLERVEQRRQTDIAMRVAAELAGEPFTDNDPPGREVTEWSRDSIANMVERLASLDWSPITSTPWAPAAVTLTYPGGEGDRWLTTAPNGKTAKKHLRTFEKRFTRAWGFEAVWVWKQEFQRRGAPHFHMLARTPPPGERAGEWREAQPRQRYRPAVGDGMLFRQWVAEVWADVVNDPDPVERAKHRNAGTAVDYAEGARCRDPKRAAVYFTKHGTFGAKAYQNIVPKAWQEPGQGPGRFWGYKGLKPATAATLIENEPADWSARIMRRWSRAQGITRQVKVARTRGGALVSKYPEVIGLAGAQLVQAHKVRRRKVRRPVVYFQQRGGFMCVNDGPAYASQLVRAVEIAGRSPDEGGCQPLPTRGEFGHWSHSIAGLGIEVLREHVQARHKVLVQRSDGVPS